ncbi:unnamed protein product [Dibothriocephalus latus]|uniref:XPG-I domain-containing protein n=1 Tax=Dibothriocephalus latus TaxID=60516 RepID=A0A3P7LM34_DIBLA|nr:unnamed protein product [Dibothriocephalus latus]
MVEADSSAEPLCQNPQDSSIPVGDMSPANPTENDHMTSKPETSSSEDEFIDVEEVVTSPSVPTVSLDSTQEGLSSRVLPDAEVDDDDDSPHEVAAAVQGEVSMEPSKPTDAPGTSYWETLVGSGEEDDFEFDDEFLRAQADRMERLAQQTSTDVIAEAQRLLFLFGLPFIVSPEEAEAQCCWLQQLGLVDVVASDDSDVWLFGARLVLRHLFTAPKDSFTAAYSAEDIHRRLGLDQAQFLRIALLCGSDYITGVPKIGPVKAMEILSEFAGRPSELPPDCPEELAVKRTVSSVIEPLEKFRHKYRRGSHAGMVSVVPQGFVSWGLYCRGWRVLLKGLPY